MDLAQTLLPDKNTQILYMQQNANQNLVIYQNLQYIWLTMNGVIQSACQLSPPYRPLLPHCYVMLLPLLHHKEPETVLELGAGGLSLQRYLNASHPDIKMTSIDNNSTVLSAVKKYFPASAHLNTIEKDAFLYLQELNAQNHSFDWLIIDLFYGADSPILQPNNSFWNDIQTLINKNGWLIINCLSREESELKQLCLQLQKNFSYPKYVFSVPEMLNHILFVHLNETEVLPQEIKQHNLFNELI